jgi:NADPH-dependent curcumin reductase CurA
LHWRWKFVPESVGPMIKFDQFRNILTQRARVQGFVILDYMDRIQEAVADLGKWLAEGKLQYRVHVVEGLEKAPHAMNMLFDGTNKGKLIVKCSS